MYSCCLTNISQVIHLRTKPSADPAELVPERQVVVVDGRAETKLLVALEEAERIALHVVPHRHAPSSAVGWKSGVAADATTAGLLLLLLLLHQHPGALGRQRQHPASSYCTGGTCSVRHHGPLHAGRHAENLRKEVQVALNSGRQEKIFTLTHPAEAAVPPLATAAAAAAARRRICSWCLAAADRLLPICCEITRSVLTSRYFLFSTLPSTWPEPTRRFPLNCCCCCCCWRLCCCRAICCCGVSCLVSCVVEGSCLGFARGCLGPCWSSWDNWEPGRDIISNFFFE